MAGQFWSPSDEGGYLYSDELSELIRMQLQPRCKFRQFTEPREADKPLHKGANFYWDVISSIGTRASSALGEREKMPETDFTITQRSLTVTEGGNSVPFSQKLEMLAKHDLVAIIEKTLREDAMKFFDASVYTQFNLTPLRATPTSGTSTTAITLDTTVQTTVTNNIEMGIEHIKLIADTMQERNIPAYMDGDYVCLSRPTTLRPVKDDLEAIHQYTETGLSMIFAGEKGRYEGIRFVEQTNIPVGGAYDSTTFDAFTGTGDAWNNAKSSWAFFFGGDTVLECLVVPEEIRAKIPTDFGRSKAIAWYYLGGYGLVHTDATNARIIKWDSAA